MLTKLASAAALLAVASAECPNACSGRGDCGTKDQCMCYDGFFGGDCSLRVCPVGNAFVDIPRGDLNHDGKIGYSSADSSVSYSKVQWSRYQQYEAWPTVGKDGSSKFSNVASATVRDIDTGDDSNVVGGWSAQPGEAHFVMECSGKGVCDRQLGVCKCYDGYTGSACQRTTCPNDCSGHGMCRTVRELAANAYDRKFLESVAGTNIYSGITQSYEYRLWDADQNSACVCDPGYGGIDCSLRECPRGDDPLTTTKPTCGGVECTDEIQSFSVDGAQGTVPGTYYFYFTDFNGVTYKTKEFELYTDDLYTGVYGSHTWNDKKFANEQAVKEALESLPNNVTGIVNVETQAIDILDSAGASVGVYGVGGPNAEDQLRLSITFTTKSGNIPELRLGWTGTSNSATRRAYVFQPGQPVKLVYIDTNAAASLNNKFQVKIYPIDQTLFGRTLYWQSPVQTINVVNKEQLGDAIQDALNSIPAIKLAYGSPFLRGGNIIATGNSGGPYIVRIAFPDKQFGKNDLEYAADEFDGTNAETAQSLADVIDGNKEAAVCSNRGLCDFGNGLCKCFTGYTGASCEVQSVLSA